MPDFCVWNRCNSNCIICTNPVGFRDENKSSPYSAKATIARIDSWKQRNQLSKESINLTGGEPTIHPDFLALLTKIREMLPENRIVLASNGRMFSYPWFAKECLKINNFVLEVAIYSSNPRLHDGMTRIKGSFKQTITGIHNILKYKNPFQELEIRIILTKLNYKDLDKTVNFIKKEFPGIDRIVIIFMELEGYAGKNFKIVGLTYKEFEPYLSLSKMEKWEKGLPEIRLYHFPLCCLKPELWKYTWRTQTPHRGGISLNEEEVTFVPRCNQCLYKKYCLGIHRDYLRLVGDKEFQPIKRKLNLRTQNNFFRPIVGVEKLS